MDAAITIKKQKLAGNYRSLGRPPSCSHVLLSSARLQRQTSANALFLQYCRKRPGMGEGRKTARIWWKQEEGCEGGERDFRGVWRDLKGEWIDVTKEWGFVGVEGI